MRCFAKAALAVLLAGIAHCASAGAIWFSSGDSLYRVDTDSNQALLMANPGRAQVLAVDPASGDIWALVHSRALKFSATGMLLTEIDLKSVGMENPEALSISPHDSSLWLADGKTLAHLDASGAVLGTAAVAGVVRPLSLGLDEHVWVLGNKQLWRYSPQGAVLLSQDIRAQVKETTKLLVVDSLGDVAWIAGEKQIVQLSLSNLTQVNVGVAAPSTIVDLSLDPKRGTVWVLSKDTLLGIGRDGGLVKSVNLEAVGIARAATVSFDAATDSLWIGYASGLARLTSGGELTSSVPTSDRVQAAGVAPFILVPTVSILKPPLNALTNNPRPEFRLFYDALCSGTSCGFPPSYFTSYRLSAMLNGQPVGSAFQLDTNTRESFFTPSSPLPEGANAFTAQVTDGFGRSSNTIANTFSVDTIAPKFLTLSPADGSVFQTPQAIIQGTIDDPLATVVLENLGLTQTGASFNFPITLQPGPNVFTLSAIDRAGNRGSTQRTLTLTSVLLSIISPTSGAVISGSTIAVIGTIQGPANTGVTVNGVVAAIAADRFYATVPLQTGANTLTAIAKTRDGFITQQAISVTSSGPAPIEVSATPQSGVAPFKVRFTVAVAANVSVQQIRADFDGNGTIDFSTTNPAATIEFTYIQPGVYAARFVITDSFGNATTQTLQIVVQDANQLDLQLKAVWSGFVSRLILRDKTAALTYLTSGAAGRYGRALDSLQGSLPAIAATLSAIKPSALSASVSEYFVTRVGPDGTVRLFLIYFLVDQDGVWRIDSM